MLERVKSTLETSTMPGQMAVIFCGDEDQPPAVFWIEPKSYVQETATEALIGAVKARPSGLLELAAHAARRMDERQRAPEDIETWASRIAESASTLDD